jgi:hypothetical protein
MKDQIHELIRGLSSKHRTLTPAEAKRDVEFLGKIMGQFFDVNFPDYIPVTDEM